MSFVNSIVHQCEDTVFQLLLKYFKLVCKVVRLHKASPISSALANPLFSAPFPLPTCAHFCFNLKPPGPLPLSFHICRNIDGRGKYDFK